MILTIGITILVLYYLVIILRFRNKQRQTDSPTQFISGRAKNIMGKSTYIVADLNSKDQDDTENNFQPLEVDFEMEYDDDELIDLEAEEMAILAQYDSQSAQGLSFEEMSQAVDAIRQKGISKESERQAVQTIAQMQQTDLFELMIEQIEGGRQRVAEMLNRIEKEVSHEKMDIEEADNVLKEFDLDKYL